MAVHVGEIHTDVVPNVAPAGEPAESSGPERLSSAEEAWREAQRCVLVTARRTAAEGFDD